MIMNTEWGNIELPGLSDEELYAKNWNRSATMQKKHLDPAYKAKYEAGTKQRDTSGAAKRWHESEKGREQYLAGRAKIRKAVIDPHGIQWPCAADAASTWFPDKTVERAVKTIRKMIADGKEWSYV